MRMWMVDPQFMCRQHLLGEHREIHALIGSMRKGLRLDGFIQKGILEPKSAHTRHDDLVLEMERRGYRHDTPIDAFEFHELISRLYHPANSVEVAREWSYNELMERCESCRRQASLVSAWRTSKFNREAILCQR